MTRELRPNTYLEHFAARALTDALNEATAHYWRRRAQAFRDAAPRPGDFTGRATPLDLAELGQRCLNTAKACERRANLIDQWRRDAPIPRDIWEALDAVA
jgi:hypothetical protein